jgi:hypothetical protein
VHKGPLGLIPKIGKKNTGSVLCWALMVFVDERLRFFNVWVEEFLDFRGVRREVTILADVNDDAKRVLAGTCVDANARAYIPLSKAYIRPPFASCARCKIRGEQRKGELRRCETAELKHFDKQCFFFSATFRPEKYDFDLYKGFSMKKIGPNSPHFDFFFFQIARFLS